MKGKLILLVGLALTGGVASGLVAARQWGDPPVPEQGLEEVLFAEGQRQAIRSGTPRVRVEGATHDFGQQAMNPGGAHTLVIHNDGDAPLEFAIRKVQGECRIQRNSGLLSIPPGESESVIIQWRPPPRPGKVRVRLELQTNDPQRPRIPITITGEVLGMIRAEPEVVRFQVRQGETARRKIRILAMGYQRVNIQRLSLNNKQTKPCFECKLLPPDPKNLLGGRGNFQIPYQEIEVQVASDLPPGRYSDHLEVFFPHQEKPSVRVALHVEVFGVFRVVSRGWDTTRGILRLGSVSQRQGRTFHLTVIGYGKEAGKASFQVQTVQPKFVQVRVGSREKIPQKDSWRWTLQLRVPENAPVGNFSANLSGSGSRIVLKTGHSEQPILEIPLSFQVIP